MTRKSVKFTSGLRPCSWKATLMKRAFSDRERVLNISISASSSKRWNELKIKLGLDDDSDVLDYLLNLAETVPQSRSISEADDLWPSSHGNTQKKSTRGPTLRAVLRRTRNENDSEDRPVEIRSSIAHLKGKSSFKDVHSRLDRKHKFRSEEEEEKEKKANQLDAELALLVETVALPSSGASSSSSSSSSSDTEPFEYRGESPSKTTATEKGKKILKVGCKRWKSYHKDKRKWKQSYAAVLEEDGSSETKPQQSESSTKNSIRVTDEPEKERRIFKGLKKKRILTAYLDSQNKIASHVVKEPCVSDKEDVPVLSKENEGSFETCSNQEMPKLQCENINSHEGPPNSSSEVEDFRVAPVLSDKMRTSSDAGKENQNDHTPDESVHLEAGDKIKFKKRKKRWNVKEVPSDVKDEAKGKLEYSVDIDKHHKKRSKSKRKQDVVPDVDNNMHLSKDKRESTHSNEPSSIISQDSFDGLEINDYNSSSDGTQSFKSEKVKETLSPKPMEQGDNAMDDATDQLPLKIKNCTYCNLKHSQQICPIQHPLNTLEDAITIEQWQHTSQIQVRCTVIEAPRAKTGRTRRCTSNSPTLAVSEQSDRFQTNAKKENDDYPLYAEESLPIGLGFQVIEEEHGKSVVARVTIAQYTQMGPLIGPFIQEKDIFDESDMRHIWEVMSEKEVVYINTDDPQKSNWLRFMRPAPVREKRNVTLAVKAGKLYFISTVDIKIGEELLFWADDHVTSWSRKKILKSNCGGCNMHFAHPLYYRTHCAVFHDPSHSLTIRKYHCKVCGEAVLGKENIMKHAADRHEGRGAYQCQFCLKFFLRLNYLEMHRTYGCASNPHRNRPLCDFCGRYFCQPQKLKVHIKRMHSDMNEVLKEFQCKSCLKILGSRAALQRHFKEVHHRDVVVSSSCDRCGKSFQNRSNLKIHMLTHSGVKPFRCQQDGCSAAFTTKQCLQFHYKKAHGLSEDSLPRIERSIAYTFDAYSGETGDGLKSSNPQPKKPAKLERKGRKSGSKSQRPLSQQVREPSHPSDRESNPAAELPSQEELNTQKHYSENQENHNHGQQSACSNDMAEMDGFGDSAGVPPLSQSLHPTVTAQKAEADTSNGGSPPPPGVLMGLHYSQEDKLSIYGGKALTPVMTVNQCYSPTSPRSPRSRSSSPVSNPGLRSMISLGLGRKKWLGEAIEVAEEAAVAAMRLSPRLSPRVKRDLYDLDEDKHISLRIDMPVETGVSRANLLTSKPAAALAPFHHPGSASLLVEAALDAAERDICCATSTTKHPSPAYRVVSPAPPRAEPQPLYYASEHAEADSYSLHPHSHGHSPVPDLHPLVHPMEGWNQTQPQPVTSTRVYETHPHHQLMHQGSIASSDEEGCGGVESDCNGADGAQNLSLNLKDKANSHTELPVMYSMAMPYQEHVPLPQQSDLNFSAAMTAPAPSPSSSPHSHPRYHMYDLSSERQTVDLSVASRSSPTSDYTAYSMDLSLPRSHTPGPGPHTGHLLLAAAPYSSQHPGPGPVYSPVPPYSSHPIAFQTSPLQRAQISSSSNSPSPSPAPSYHPYSVYY